MILKTMIFLLQIMFLFHLASGHWVGISSVQGRGEFGCLVHPLDFYTEVGIQSKKILIERQQWLGR